MKYHISWLEVAVNKAKENNYPSVVDGDMTINEFLHLVICEDLQKMIKVD